MLASTFLGKLKKMNRRLDVCSIDNSPNLAGIYYRCPKEGILDICGIDKNFIPEYPEFDSRGHVIRSGWRRSIKILLNVKTIDGEPIITREKVKKQFGDGFFDVREPNWLRNIESGNEVNNLLEKRKARALDRTGVAALSKEDLLEAHAILDKNYKTNEDRDKMDRETWAFKKDPNAYVQSVSGEELNKVRSNWTTNEKQFGQE